MTTQTSVYEGAAPALPGLRALVREALARTASAEALPARLDADSPLVRSTVQELTTPAAREAMEADPYWPKWKAPRWKMLLLRELGLAESIPRTALDELTEVMDRRYLHSWPMRKEELPPEPRPPFLCHCNLASFVLLLGACGRDVDRALPWAVPWLLRCQLPDGGLNCTLRVYWKPDPHGGMTSTIAPLEAMLLGLARPWSAEERAFLERGAQYLLRHGLCRRYAKANGSETEWFEPQFPRYYHYDLLRGLSFVTLWAERTGQRLPAAPLAEAVAELTRRLDGQGALASRAGWPEDEGNWEEDAQGKSVRVPEAGVFPLLAEVSRPGAPSPYLTGEWREALARLERLDAAGLLH